MINLRFYIDKDYNEVITVLKEGGLFDEVRETRENLKNKIKKDSESRHNGKKGVAEIKFSKGLRLI